MQLINHIGPNATTGKILLGMIPATGFLLKCRPAIQKMLGIQNTHRHDLVCAIVTAEQALSILSTISLVSLPFSTEKKALFAVISLLVIASPLSSRIVLKFGGSENKVTTAKKITMVCVIVTRIWTVFMVSAAVGFKSPNNFSYSRAGIALFLVLIMRSS